MPHVVFAAPSAYLLGGLASWLDYLLPGLRQRGWTATLGLVEGPVHHCPTKYLSAHPNGDWIAVRARSCTAHERRRQWMRALSRLKPDLVVSVNIPDALAAAIRSRQSAKSEVRTVFACHGIENDLFGDAELFRNDVDAFVCVNRLACELMIARAGVAADRVHYAPCGVSATERPGFEYDDVLTIAYVGRLESSQKRILDVAAIWNRVASSGLRCRFLVAGTGPAESAFRSALAALPSTAEVCFLGHIPQRKLAAQVYRRSHVLLLTSYWETGPIVIWEAMAHGVAVVSSSYIGSGLESALEHGRNCLLFPIGDVESAATHILKLGTDQELKNRLSLAACHTVETRYSEEASINTWHRVLSQVCDQAPRPVRSQAFAARASGRIASLVGEQPADWLRRIARRRPPLVDPGSEWPHALTHASNSDSRFWQLAAGLDQCNDRSLPVDDRREP